jgi:antitoxin (DNA-binding transcriptional repressor) of toxin-antitoxin stability system
METISISELKARLSSELRKVRAGIELVVLDRDKPVAMLVPYEAGTLEVRPPDKPLPRRPPRLRVAADPVAVLLEERRSR